MDAPTLATFVAAIAVLIGVLAKLVYKEKATLAVLSLGPELAMGALLAVLIVLLQWKNASASLASSTQSQNCWLQLFGQSNVQPPFVPTQPPPQPTPPFPTTLLGIVLVVLLIILLASMSYERRIAKPARDGKRGPGAVQVFGLGVVVPLFIGLIALGIAYVGLGQITT